MDGETATTVYVGSGVRGMTRVRAPLSSILRAIPRQARHMVELVSVVGAVSCGVTHSVIPDVAAAWRSGPRHRSSTEMEQAGRALIAELSRLLVADSLVGAMPASAFLRGYGDDPKVAPPVPHFAARLLSQAYAAVQPSLRRVYWQDTTPSFAESSLGVFLNRRRVAELAWVVDSITLGIDPRGLAQILIRTPGDWVPLVLAGHELAHFAIDASPASMGQPAAVLECSADILAGFQAAAVAPRVSARGTDDLERSDVLSIVGHSLVPGDWVARELHPDQEERTACLTRGLAIYTEQRDREPFAGSVIVETRGDSLLDDLSMGRISLAETAVTEARRMLPVPNPERAPASSRDWRSTTSVQAAELGRLVGVLLGALDTAGVFQGVFGDRLSSGTSLFPATEILELTTKVEPPWKCAGLMSTPGRERSVVCYAIGSMFQLFSFGTSAGSLIEGESRRAGFDVRIVTPPLKRDSDLALDQWLIERGRQRLIVTLSTEPLGRVDGYGSRSSTRVYWLSVAPISPGPRR